MMQVWCWTPWVGWCTPTWSTRRRGGSSAGRRGRAENSPCHTRRRPGRGTMLSRAAGGGNSMVGVEQLEATAWIVDSSCWRQHHALSRAAGGNSMIGVEQLEATAWIFDSSSWRQPDALSWAAGGNSLVGVLAAGRKQHGLFTAAGGNIMRCLEQLEATAWVVYSSWLRWQRGLLRAAGENSMGCLQQLVEVTAWVA